MPVVISEFEVVPAGPASPQNAGAKRSEESIPPKAREKPHWEDVLRHWRERAERIRAH